MAGDREDAVAVVDPLDRLARRGSAGLRRSEPTNRTEPSHISRVAGDPQPHRPASHSGCGSSADRPVEPDHRSRTSAARPANRGPGKPRSPSLPDQRRAKRMRQQEMGADEGDAEKTRPSLRGQCRYASGSVARAAASGSGRAAWSGGCRAAGATPSIHTASARARALERIARPDHHVAAAARRRGCRSRRPGRPPRPAASVIIANASPQLTPVAPGTLRSATRLPAYCRWLRTGSACHCRRSCRSTTLTPAARIRPTLDWVAASCSNDAGRSLTAEAITGTPDAAMPVGDRPALGRADQHQLERREFALEAEHLQDVAGPLDMDQQILPALQHRHQRRGVEPGQQHVLAAPRVGRRRAAIRWDRGSTGRSRSSGSRRAPPASGAAKRRSSRRLAQRVAEQHDAPRRASRRPCPRRPRPARRTGSARAAVIGSMSAPVSMTAPWPAKMLLPATGATIARVTPSARLTAMVEASGLIAGATSIAALNGPLPARCRRDPSAPRSTSARPSREKPATMPGVTHLPVRVDDLARRRERATDGPAATMRPLRIDHRARPDRLRAVARARPCRR